MRADRTALTALLVAGAGPAATRATATAAYYQPGTNAGAMSRAWELRAQSLNKILNIYLYQYYLNFSILIYILLTFLLDPAWLPAWYSCESCYYPERLIFSGYALCNSVPDRDDQKGTTMWQTRRKVTELPGLKHND